MDRDGLEPFFLVDDVLGCEMGEEVAESADALCDQKNVG